MGSSGSVLVVDDDLAMRDMVSSLLRSEGFDVVAAIDADDALAALASGSVRAVLSDIRMPGKSGFDFLSSARSTAPTVPVVLMTSFGSGLTIDRALRDGAFGCLSKPFSREELLDVLSRALADSLPVAPEVSHALELLRR